MNEEGVERKIIRYCTNYNRRIRGKNPALVTLLARDRNLDQNMDTWFNRFAQAGIDLSRPR